MPHCHLQGFLQQQGGPAGAEEAAAPAPPPASHSAPVAGVSSLSPASRMEGSCRERKKAGAQDPFLVCIISGFHQWCSNRRVLLAGAAQLVGRWTGRAAGEGPEDGTENGRHSGIQLAPNARQGVGLWTADSQVGATVEWGAAVACFYHAWEQRPSQAEAAPQAQVRRQQLPAVQGPVPAQPAKETAVNLVASWRGLGLWQCPASGRALV